MLVLMLRKDFIPGFVDLWSTSRSEGGERLKEQNMMKRRWRGSSGLTPTNLTANLKFPLKSLFSTVRVKVKLRGKVNGEDISSMLYRFQLIFYLASFDLVGLKSDSRNSHPSYQHVCG